MTGTDAIGRLVSETVGGEIVRIARAGGGRSRTIHEVDVERNGRRLALLVRGESGAGPHAGTRFNLRREAAALAMLEGRGVMAPRVYGVSDDAIVLERLAGAPTIPADERLRGETIADFCAALAALHAVDLGSLLPHLPPPADAGGGALADLADWRDSYDRLCVRHRVIDDAFAWLGSNIVRDGRPCIVHGDAGPGNFMHENGRLTGLIDFEFLHFGDPHEDLAWIWFRVNMIGQDREADTYFRAYLDASGLSFDPARCRMFIVQTILRCAVSGGVRQHNDPSYGDARPAELRQWLADALADAREGRLSRLPQLPACAN